MLHSSGLRINLLHRAAIACLTAYYTAQLFLASSPSILRSSCFLHHFLHHGSPVKTTNPYAAHPGRPSISMPPNAPGSLSAVHVHQPGSPHRHILYCGIPLAQEAPTPHYPACLCAFYALSLNLSHHPPSRTTYPVSLRPPCCPARTTLALSMPQYSDMRHSPKSRINRTAPIHSMLRQLFFPGALYASLPRLPY